MLLVAGCGGQKASRGVTIAGPGYRFAAPGGWKVARTGSSVEASSGDRAVSVTAFRLARAYRPALWPKAVPELDRVARGLAEQLHGKAGPGTTLTVAGMQARRYDISFRRGGKELVERITFVLDGRREYQLLCRYPAGGAPGEADRACAALARSFRLR